MSIKDITVVITTFKSDKKIKNCLNSIDKQCKVIIVENSNNLEFKKNFEQKFSYYFSKVVDFFSFFLILQLIQNVILGPTYEQYLVLF